MTRNSFTVRDAVAADIPAVARLESGIFSHPWTQGDFEGALAFGFSALFVAETDGEIVGYANLTVADGDGALNNLAVAPELRGRGAGDALLKRVIAEARARGAAVIALEVRTKNAAARRLYENNGFCAAGLRRGFYRDPDDDAVVMLLDLEKCNADSGN